MAAKGALGLLALTIIALVSACGGSLESQRMQMRRMLQDVEYDLELKGILDNWNSIFGDLLGDNPSTSQPIRTTLALTTTTAPSPTVVNSSPRYHSSLKVDRIVNCLNYYELANRDQSKRDNIYNLMVIQCMTDPALMRLMNFLDDYDNQNKVGYEVNDFLEWMFDIFDDTEPQSGNRLGQESNEQELLTPNVPPKTSFLPTHSTVTQKPTTSAPKPTTAAPEPTTAAPERTTAAPEPTTTAPKPTTVAPNQTTAAPKPTTAAPQAADSMTSTPNVEMETRVDDTIGEDNDEEAVKELLLQRVLYLLRKEKLDRGV